MSLPSTSRTSTFRQGLTALAAATALLAAGLVTAPAAQALPVVDTSTSRGTTVTTSMFASGSTIWGNVDAQELYPARFGYTVAVKASGGRLARVEAEVTVQKIDREPVRKRTIVMDRTSSTAMVSRGRIPFHGSIDPGTYYAGVEIFAVVRKADGTRVRHQIDVHNANKVQFRRATWTRATISTEATDGRPARINATTRVLRIDDDGTLSWLRLRSGDAILSFDADGPYEEGRAVFVRDLTIGSDARISTVVKTREGYWKVTYPGNSRFASSTGWIPELCSC
ncbi:hypothetical protein [Promicromonospora panici]|uniref:hypothetical protein n=1 Tax=Promicromonospora panici TaxID=2219658 RepID=UPI00101DC49A|nr:hypothetical protein [Promicromonospora panici]